MDMNLTDRVIALGNLVGYTGMAYVEADLELNVISWNRGAADLFGRSEADAIGGKLYDLLPVEKEILSGCTETCRDSCVVTGEKNRRIWYDFFLTPILNARGEKTGLSILVKDVSESVRRDNAFEAYKRELHEIYSFAPVGIFKVDRAEKVVLANPEFAWMLGYESSDALIEKGLCVRSQVFVRPEEARDFIFRLNEAEEVNRFKCRLRRKDGVSLWTYCFAKLTRGLSGRVDGFNGFAFDISATVRTEEALRKANEKLTRMSSVDGLTQIPNRRTFDGQLENEWRRHKREEKPLSVILADIDYFKRFNDTYGHQKGDLCLKQVARTIDRNISRAGDLAARYGGEEFAVILPATDAQGAAVVAEKIRERVRYLQIPHISSDVHDHVTLSLGGASLTPNAENTPADLLSMADKALYQAKGEGRNRVVVAPMAAGPAVPPDRSSPDAGLRAEGGKKQADEDG